MFDVGCGTGLSLSMLRHDIGPKGRIVGIEQSPEMVVQARWRVVGERWIRVTLLCPPVEDADIRVNADAALFHLTHDILQRLEAMANVMRHLKPGARVVTSLDGMDQPWRLLQDQLGQMNVESRLLGAAYIASGIYAPTRRTRGPATSSSPRPA